ncbi:hypothetical protein [Halobaculum sp. P14]|uniref:hypothetical protein n=1 Tax=Halobaculum sp. P14 TaxID=3421638 RepID=UPI003EB71BE9
MTSAPLVLPVGMLEAAIVWGGRLAKLLLAALIGYVVLSQSWRASKYIVSSAWYRRIAVGHLALVLTLVLLGAVDGVLSAVIGTSVAELALDPLTKVLQEVPL